MTEKPTAIERAVADGGYAVRNGDRKEVLAETERFVTDCDYAVRNGDRMEVLAETERFVADCGYGVSVQRIRNGQY